MNFVDADAHNVFFMANISFPRNLLLKISKFMFLYRYNRAKSTLQHIPKNVAKIEIDFKKLNIPSPRVDFSTLLFDPSDEGASVELYAWGFREPVYTYMLYDFLFKEKSNFDCIIDVGSHVGYFPLIELASGVKSILAIEPNPNSYAYLKRNLNCFKNVKTMNIAISNKDKYIKMLIAKSSNLSRIVNELAQINEMGEIIDVKGLSLETVIHSQGLKGASVFLRMDVEGYETIILEKIPSEVCGLSFELHPSILGVESTMSLLRKLSKLSFKAYALTYEGIYMYPIIKALGLTATLQLLKKIKLSPIILKPSISKSERLIASKLQPHIFMLRNPLPSER